MDRVVVFIDNSNVYRRLRDLKKIDPQWVCLYDPLVLAQKLAGARELVGVYFYCTPPPAFMLKTPEGQKNHALQTKYYAEIQKQKGVTVKFGNLQLSGPKPVEKNLDTQLTADMVKLAATNSYETAILVSNDGDYMSAVQPTKDEFGKKIEILYFKGIESTALRMLADVPRKARPSFFQRMPMP